MVVPVFLMLRIRVQLGIGYRQGRSRGVVLDLPKLDCTSCVGRQRDQARNDHEGRIEGHECAFGGPEFGRRTKPDGGISKKSQRSQKAS